MYNNNLIIYLSFKNKDKHNYNLLKNKSKFLLKVQIGSKIYHILKNKSINKKSFKLDNKTKKIPIKFIKKYLRHNI